MSNYHTFIVSVAELRFHFDYHVKQLTHGLNIQLSDYEYLYDWLIHQAVSNVLNGYGAKLDGAYRHDIYLCVYDKIGHIFENALRSHFFNHRIYFSSNDHVKILVAGDIVTLAKRNSYAHRL